MLVDRINSWVRRIPNWTLYILYALPAPWLFYLGMTGGLGAEPIKALEHELGEIALQLLVIGLCITPLRRFLGINLIRFRRAFGLLAFFYVTLHLLVWLVLDVQILGQVWADIVKRPYITVGMVAFALMIPLAITSNNWSVRKLGTRWRALHKLTYAVGLLGATHFVMLSKGFQLEPLIYLAVILALLVLRGTAQRQGRAARSA
ncbi:protein-methionine-sulfoxide reductase heme-binding subunit MsrQ [Thalassococcus sp. CAU 1522]|uniref:Protein-methionine-sulfoxide reductase heme-binding subunit MsrQ n=1 Tax=Thalassococcus arenae TaxID=2851652 RepID=A0ABS6N568_9RHOB|nr:protein-methionine-sulfoxide reductase heme-binding subunit MsrQ [Thalassococcus arenae]MBV2359157.1 protein-methionine-sulfoxide reductase heme-binding subunit MsrQ [Thalassococcus arenae]